MRRALAAAVLGISLWIGALAWSGFVMTRTVLDPDRSEDVAEALLEDEAVRDQLVTNIAGGIRAGLPEGVRMDDATLESGAEQALESPAVERILLDAFVGAHRAFLGEGEAPQSIDGGAFGGAARQSVVDAHPELDGLLPESPSLEVALPTERIPDAGPVRRGLLTAVPILATCAAIGVLSALLISTDRPAVIRRAAVWALALSAFVLLFAFGVPALAQYVAPSQAEVVAALVGALAATTRGPALALAGAGILGLLVSAVWRSGRAREREPAPRPVASGGARRPHRDLPTPGRRPVPARRPVPSPRSAAPDRTTIGAAPSPPPAPARPPAQAHPPATGADPTRVESAADPSAPPVADDAPRDRPSRAGARWQPGVGWVHDGTGPIPESARWMPGVGYVLDD